LKIKALNLVAVLAALAVACGGTVTGTSGNGGGGGTAGGGSGGTAGTGPADASFHDGPSSTLDVALPPLDATLASLDAAPPGLAGFAFIVNDVVQHPLTCSSEDWEFSPQPGGGSGCGLACMGGCTCPGIKSVIVANTGALDMAYVAAPSWDVPSDYAPGVDPGGQYKAGVLAPGAYVNITAFYNGGMVALLGSARPFSALDSRYVGDEGTIPWPTGVKGSGGATTMYLAEIEVETSCQPAFKAW
jgi:hypothetical protein